MKARQILLPRYRYKRLVVAVNGVVTRRLFLLEERDAADLRARTVDGAVFEVALESTMTKAKLLTRKWEVVRRDGRRWVPAAVGTRICTFCEGRGGQRFATKQGGIKLKRCRKCHSAGRVSMFQTYWSEDDARSAMQTALLGSRYAKLRVRKVPL